MGDEVCEAEVHVFYKRSESDFELALCFCQIWAAMTLLFVNDRNEIPNFGNELLII